MCTLLEMTRPPRKTQYELPGDTPIARALRIAASKGLSQAEFARRMDVSEQRMTNWKKRGMPSALYAKAAEVLGCSIEALLRDGPPARFEFHLADGAERPYRPTPFEWELISAYRGADPRDQRLARIVLGMEDAERDQLRLRQLGPPQGASIKPRK